MANWMKTLWRDNRSDFLFFAVMFSAIVLFRTTAYGMYFIPSESMQPTLEVGDRIAVNKFVYGYSRYSAPFGLLPSFQTDNGRVFGGPAARGDVVVFRHPRTGETYIKRVIGLPGEEVQLVQGRVVMNGETVARLPVDQFSYRQHKGPVVEVVQFHEEFPDGARHDIYEMTDYGIGDQTSVFTVPDQHLFVMGDNRDNSLDSRFMDIGVGFVPVENIIGRADMVLFSLHRCGRQEGLRCAARRFFSKMDQSEVKR